MWGGHSLEIRESLCRQYHFSILKKLIYIYVLVYVYVQVLELQMVVCCPIWTLGTELWFSPKAASPLNSSLWPDNVTSCLLVCSSSPGGVCGWRSLSTPWSGFPVSYHTSVAVCYLDCTFVIWLTNYKIFSGPLGRNLNFFLEAVGELLEISEQAGNMLEEVF